MKKLLPVLALILIALGTNAQQSNIYMNQLFVIPETSNPDDAISDFKSKGSKRIKYGDLKGDTLLVTDIDYVSQSSNNKIFTFRSKKTETSYQLLFKGTIGFPFVPVEKESFAVKYSRLPIKDGRVIYEEIISAEGLSKQQLYLNARTWFVNSFNNAQRVIQMDDKESGTIIGKGNFKTSYTSILASYVELLVEFTINISAKDGKYRVQIYDFDVTNKSASNSVTSKIYLTQEQEIIDTGRFGKKEAEKRVNAVNNYIIELLTNIKSKMTTKQNIDW